MTDRNRWIALYVLCTGMLMIVLDVTVVNVALPTIQDDLGFSQASLAWVVNAYLISFGGLLLLAGRLGDILGRTRMFLAGLAVFTVASLLCGLAQSQELLVGARFLQGVGGAMTSAVILGMIVTMFPEPREQAKAIGVFAFVASAGGSIGLLAGGLLTQSINWHWIFFVNVPIAIVTAVLAGRLLDRDKGIGFGGGADVSGAVLITSSLMLGVYTIVKPAAELGWTSAQTLALGAGSLALLAAFVVREARTGNPLVPLRIFRSRNVSGANVIQALSVAGMFGMFFLGSLYLQRVLGYSALEIGLAFLPVTIVMGILSVRYSERLVMRFGARPTLLPGLVFIAVGLLLFTQAPVDGSYLQHVLPPVILFGLGAGLSFPALMNLAMSAATQEDAGLASGLVNTSAQVGGALGLAVLATLSGSRTEALAKTGEEMASALTGGYHLAFVIGAGLVLAAIVVAVAVLEPEAQAESDTGARWSRCPADLVRGRLRVATPRISPNAWPPPTAPITTGRRPQVPASYTLKNLSEIPDSAPQFGLEKFQKTRFAHGDLETEQTGFTHHRIEANARPPFAHRHQRAEEVYVVLSGSGRVKLDDEILEIETHDAVRVAPSVTRAWEPAPTDSSWLRSVRATRTTAKSCSTGGPNDGPG